MKKYILSTLVVFSFGTFVIFQKITETSSTSSVKINKKNNPVATTVKPVTVPSTTPIKVTSTVNTTNTNTVSGLYKDGEYNGDSVNAYYGNVQVKAVISGGKLADVQILDYPQDRNTSIRINDYAMPLLRSEAIHAQNANVDTVSGATHSSGAFKKSLQSALSQAANS